MSMISNLQKALCVGMLCGGAAAAGCAAQDAPAETDGMGTLSVPLQQVGSDGRPYLLSGVVDVLGPNGSLGSLPLDGVSPLDMSVAPGLYTVTLHDGWSLSASNDNGLTYQPVSALLGSPNSLQVRVLANHTDAVTFQFLVRSASGTLNIGFGVTAHPREFAGAIRINTADGWLAGYAGRTIDFATYYAAFPFQSSSAAGKLLELSSIGSATEFFNDPLGILANQVGPNLQGAFLDWGILVGPDGSQTLTASLFSQIGPGTVNLFVNQEPLPVALPLDANGFIEDQFFQENVPFQLAADDGTTSGTATGELRMRNVPFSN